MLYLPRGVIHQGKTHRQPAKKAAEGDVVEEETHSLHVTLSNQQHNSWADLMQASVNQVIKRVTMQDAEYRAALPV